VSTLSCGTSTRGKSRRAGHRVELDVVEEEPVAPEETTGPATLTAGVATNGGSLVLASRSGRDVEVVARLGFKDVVHTVQDGVEGRHHRDRERAEEEVGLATFVETEENELLRIASGDTPLRHLAMLALG